jgi:hypothetical protein
VGLWLISGLYRRGAWLGSVAIFGVMFCISLYMVLAGQPSCGCFGSRLTISPWYTLVFDIGALIALCAWRPGPALANPRSASRLPKSLARSTSVVIGALTVSGSAYLALRWIDASPPAALAYLRGEALTIEPSDSDVGRISPGERRTARIKVRNHRSRPIRIVGGWGDCSCNVVGDLPLVVPARDTRTLDITVTYRSRAGAFRLPFFLYTGEQSQPAAVACVSGYVDAVRGSAASVSKH